MTTTTHRTIHDMSFEIRTLALPGGAGHIAIIEAEDHDFRHTIRRPWANARLAIAAAERWLIRILA